MRPWILFIFASLAIGLIVGKKDNRVTSQSDTRIHLEENEVQCWNTYFNSKCFSDYLSNQPERRNRLFGFDPNSIADDSGDDMRKVEADNTGVIPSDFQVSEKRSLTTMNSDCDCQVKNDYKDLGQMHYPRYIITALCQDDRQKKLQSRKFWRGSQCKPVEYIVHVLTPRLRSDSHDDTLVPDSLRPFWKFDKVTVTTGCFCSF
ncbi:prothoracicotropic hormone [Hermetia illucens]|uniref:prothoracicotropic hormone n=1 Tax=Hermetia illucens TaxID=343691 RepID=UPI0018CC47CA|nr:prothoracicotropic hormone [Hermetia illucens]